MFSNRKWTLFSKFHRCSGAGKCKALQYNGTRPGNCVLIRDNSAPNGTVFISSISNIIFLKGKANVAVFYGWLPILTSQFILNLQKKHSNPLDKGAHSINIKRQILPQLVMQWMGVSVVFGMTLRLQTK